MRSTSLREASYCYQATSSVPSVSHTRAYVPSSLVRCAEVTLVDKNEPYAEAGRAQHADTPACKGRLVVSHSARHGTGLDHTGTKPGRTADSRARHRAVGRRNSLLWTCTSTAEPTFRLP